MYFLFFLLNSMRRLVLGRRPPLHSGPSLRRERRREKRATTNL